jgi:deoxyribose-phosphate aldolase
MSEASLARFIDHTLLKPGAKGAQIDSLCREALEHAFYSVCVHPIWLPRARQALRGSEVELCTVVAFPHGELGAKAKGLEASCAVEAGATEVDMVAARSLIHASRWSELRREVQAVVDASNAALPRVKVILETASLSPDEIRAACESVVEAGAHFVKTSTGFGEGGASVEAVQLMRECVGPDFGVKASGGIRDLQAARAMLDAGANRLGCSAGVAIVRGERSSSADY